MKQSDYPRLKNELTLILPIHQKEAWTQMHISHQDMSDVVILMEKEGLITRTKSKFKGSQTYFIELRHKKQKKNFSSLISGTIFSPCTGCKSPDCFPTDCDKLISWVAEPLMEKL